MILVVDQMNHLRVRGVVAGEGVHLQLAEAGGEGHVRFHGDVLVAEKEHLALDEEPGERIDGLRLVIGTQIDAMHLGANARRQVHQRQFSIRFDRGLSHACSPQRVPSHSNTRRQPPSTAAQPDRPHRARCAGSRPGHAPPPPESRAPPA